MTIIAANLTHMGCDTAGTTETLQQNFGIKIIQIGNNLVGYTGSYMLDYWLRRKCTDFTDHEELEDAWLEYLEFTRAGGHDTGSVIFLCPFGLYLGSPDGSLLQPEQNFLAIGAGESLALGALYTLRNSKISNKQKIEKAIEVAIEYSPYCNGEIAVVGLKDV